MFSITELLKELNVPTAPEDHHHRTPGREQVDCPWCSRGSYKWRLGISYSGRFASCWTCGSVNVAESLADLTELPIGAVRKLLAGIESLAIRHEEKKRGTLVMPEGVRSMMKPHRKYLESRG